MKYYSTLLFILILLYCGCSKYRHNESARWAAISPDIDSISAALDSAEALMFPPSKKDSLWNELRRSSAPQQQNLLQARILFWDAMIHHSQSDDTQSSETLSHALALVDSASAPYDYMRIKEAYFTHSRLSPARVFNIQLEALEYYRSVDDSVTMLRCLNDLGRTMWTIREYDRSLSFVNQTLELSCKLKLKMQELSALNNKAIMLQSLGQEKEARAIMAHLDTIPELSADLNLYCNFLSNASWFLNRPHYLNKVRELRRGNPEEVCNVDLLLNTLHENNMDSVKKYTTLIRNSMDSVHNATTLARAHKAIYVYNLYLGQTDSALYHLEKYVTLYDSILVASYPSEIRAMDQKHELAVFESLKNSERRQTSMKMWIIILTMTILLIICGFAGWQIIRKIRRKARRAKMAADLAHRSLAASRIAIESKTKLLDKIEDQIVDLQSEGNISGKGAHSIKSVISIDRAATDEDVSFIESHEKIHPAFYERMKAKYPSITEGQLQFASYILMNMTSKQIARLLMIQPEAVKKRRHRLRTVMCLDAKDSLEDTLRLIARDK